jgi:hypothetical protein
MPWRGLSTGFSNPAGAVCAATIFSYSDGKLWLGTRRRGFLYCTAIVAVLDDLPPKEYGGDDGVGPCSIICKVISL